MCMAFRWMKLQNQRRDAKVINFGVLLYGMGPHALAQNTGMTFAEAKSSLKCISSFVRRFVSLLTTRLKSKNRRVCETFHGRRRPTPDVKQQLHGA